MVTQLSATEQWVYNLEQGEAFQAAAQQQSIGQRGMCTPVHVCVCVSMCMHVCASSRCPI